MQKIILTMAVICVALLQPAEAQSPSEGQSPYTIDITGQPVPVRTHFLKMGTDRAPDGEILSYNNRFLTRNGRPWFPIMGEMHFSRCNKKDWEESIIKMKSCGIEVITSYVFWDHHEPAEGQFDWTGNRDLHTFLSLCAKYHMYVWLRIGPWIHAEARNGGFPDWLLNRHIGLRKNDSAYLHYAKKWFEAVAGQCEGYYYKQSGTIIGIQLENEMVFKDSAAYEHMKTLKQLAVNAGFDLPYYSAFAQGPDTQDEFLYMIGGYPDSPWAQHTHKMFKPVFFIRPLESDRDIGSDLLGRIDGKVRNTYPKLSAELGAGMQKTYHRRVDVSPADIGALALTRVASGLNGMGYFMFHGGLNPVGSTTLQESRLTGYPNDLPYINYDFQAPVGAMDIIGGAYDELKLINLFLRDYGATLCTEAAFFPHTTVSTANSRDTVQCSVRAGDNAGFIFLSNYQRFIDLPPVAGFQLHLAAKDGSVATKDNAVIMKDGLVTTKEQIVDLPEKPVTFPANSYAIWPYNLPMGDVVLQYATAQPLCVLHNGGEESYVFFSGESSEFVYDAALVGTVTPICNCRSRRKKDRIYIDCGKKEAAAFGIVSPAGKKINVLVLPREQALQAVKVSVGTKELCLWGDAHILVGNEGPIVEKVAAAPIGERIAADPPEKIATDPLVKISVYPDMPLQAASDGFTFSRADGNGVWADYTIGVKEKPAGSFDISVDSSGMQTPAEKEAALHFRDSVLRNYATSSKFDPLQPGPLYQYIFHSLPSQRLYDIRFRVSRSPLVRDWIASIQYQGDVLALYSKDTLVYDQFNYNDTCRIRLHQLFPEGEEKMKAQVLPMPKEYDIYVEDKMRNERAKEWTHPAIRTITLTPVWWFPLMLNKIYVRI